MSPKFLKKGLTLIPNYIGEEGSSGEGGKAEGGKSAGAAIEGGKLRSVPISAHRVKSCTCVPASGTDTGGSEETCRGGRGAGGGKSEGDSTTEGRSRAGEEEDGTVETSGR